MAKTPIYDVTLFRKVIKAQGRSTAWLAQKAGYDVGYLRNVLAGHDPLSDKLAFQLAYVLDAPLFMFRSSK